MCVSKNGHHGDVCCNLPPRRPQDPDARYGDTGLMLVAQYPVVPKRAPDLTRAERYGLARLRLHHHCTAILYHPMTQYKDGFLAINDPGRSAALVQGVLGKH